MKYIAVICGLLESFNGCFGLFAQNFGKMMTFVILWMQTQLLEHSEMIETLKPYLMWSTLFELFAIPCRRDHLQLVTSSCPLGLTFTEETSPEVQKWTCVQQKLKNKNCTCFTKFFSGLNPPGAYYKPINLFYAINHLIWRVFNNLFSTINHRSGEGHGKRTFTNYSL